MKLKTQIAVIVLGLAASTSLGVERGQTAARNNPDNPRRVAGNQNGSRL